MTYDEFSQILTNLKTNVTAIQNLEIASRLSKSQISQILTSLKTNVAAIQDIEVINQGHFFLNWGDKVVYHLDDNIYKIDSPFRTMHRIVMRDYALSLNLDILLEETKVPSLSNEFWLVTEQKELTEIIKFPNDDDIYNYLPESIKSNFRQFQQNVGLWDLGHSNVGYDENHKLWIFDYLDHVTVQQDITTGKWQIVANDGTIIFEELIDES